MNTRKDGLLSRLERIPVKGEIILESENARNRALKFARENRRMFITLQDGQGDFALEGIMTIREQDILRKALEAYEKTIPHPSYRNMESRELWVAEEIRLTRGLIARLCGAGKPRSR